MWDIGLLGGRLCVIENEACREEAPQNGQVWIKSHYLLQLDPSTSWGWLLIVSMILFRVPIFFIIAFPIFDVFVFILFFSTLLVEVVLSAILLIELFESFAPEQLLSSLALLPMMFISVDKVLVIGVVFESFFDSFLLLSELIFHPAPLWPSIFSVLPIVIRILVLKVSSGGLSED